MKKTIIIVILAFVVYVGYQVIQNTDYSSAKHNRTKRVINNVKSLPGL